MKEAIFDICQVPDTRAKFFTFDVNWEYIRNIEELERELCEVLGFDSITVAFMFPQSTSQISIDFTRYSRFYAFVDGERLVLSVDRLPRVSVTR